MKIRVTFREITEYSTVVDAENRADAIRLADDLMYDGKNDVFNKEYYSSGDGETFVELEE